MGNGKKEKGNGKWEMKMGNGKWEMKTGLETQNGRDQ